MSKGKKVPATFKLPPERLDKLKALAQDEGVSQAVLIEQALSHYEASLKGARFMFMELYDMLNRNIFELEMKRDTAPDGKYMQGVEGNPYPSYLNEDESQTLDFYHKIWNEFRKQPFFHEPDLD